ncbi:MAG TPA: hypothetical protein VGF07_01985 [Stellaceae bacterium]|jgi:hypothetical protein
MGYAIQDDIMGMPPIAGTNPVQGVPLGMLCHAVDPVLGGGEFIYLAGCAGTVAGSLVSYDQVNRTTTLGAGAGGHSGRPLAVAMSANLANQYGWYQISGAATVQKDGTALTAGGAVGLGTVNGTVGAVTAGQQIDGAAAVNAAAAGAATALVTLSRPSAQGQIT